MAWISRSGKKFIQKILCCYGLVIFIRIFGVSEYWKKEGMDEVRDLSLKGFIWNAVVVCKACQR